MGNVIRFFNSATLTVSDPLVLFVHHHGGLCFTEEKGIKYQTFWTLTANPHVLAPWL